MTTTPPPPPSTTELLIWHPAAELPDADMSVLLWFTYAGAESGDFAGTETDPGDWCAGWWDGEAWRDCAHGGVVDANVTHWAELNGPTGEAP